MDLLSQARNFLSRKVVTPIDVHFRRAIGPQARIVTDLSSSLKPPMARIPVAAGYSRLAGTLIGRAAMPYVLANQVSEVFDPKDNIVTSLQNLGTSIQNLNVPLPQQRHYVGSDPYAVRMNRAIEAAATSQPISSGGGRSDRAPTDAELRAQGYGTGVHDDDPFNLRGRGGGGQGGTTPIVTGLTRSGAVDRTQSDTYRQYAGTPEGQFERYFKTPEMDRYFGAASRGAGAPKSAEEMMTLAGQAKAPTGAGNSLASYYRAQSAAGRGNMEEIISSMGYKGPMADWAKANPMLAMREFNKRFPAGQPTTGGGELTSSEALKGVKYQGVGGQGFPAATAPAATAPAPAQTLSESDVVYKGFPANSVPALWNTQGALVSAPFEGVKGLQAAKTTPGGVMPLFQTTGENAAERAAAFLKRPNISSLF